MKLFQELDKLEIPDNEAELPIEQKIGLYAGVLIALLTFVKMFTRDKGDDKIDHIIEFLAGFK